MSATITTLAESITAWLTDFYMLATLLLAAAFVSLRFLRQPVHRIVVAWIVVMELAVLVVVCALPGWPRISLVRKTPPTPSPAVRLADVSAGEPAALSPLPANARLGYNMASAPVAPGRISQLLSFRALVGEGFLVGAALAGVWLLWGALAMARLCWRATPAPRALVAHLQELVGNARLPRLLLSPQVSTATALIALRPTILLPSALAENGQPHSVRAVLAHEWAHIRHRDLWLLAFGRGLLTLLFAHPLYWWLRARIRDDQETLADAVAAGDNRHAYAQELLGWVRLTANILPFRVTAGVGIWENTSQLTRRIAMLLDETFAVQTAVSRRWKYRTVGLLMCLGAAVSILTLQPRQSTAQQSPPKDEVQVRGTVVDSEGQPVSKAEVGFFWTPNNHYDEQGNRRDPKKDVKLFWTNTGVMRPRKEAMATTDELGRFVLLKKGREYGVLAYDAERQRGGVVTLHDDDESSQLVIHLQALVHLHGKFRSAETNTTPDWALLDVILPEDERKPLAFRRVAVCGSLDGDFSVMLPPGEYELYANTDETDEVLDPPLTVKLTETKPDYDLGTLRLYAHVSTSSKIKDAKQRGEWGDYTKSFGRAPPRWHAVAARGISAETKPADLKGKWTLIYFFGWGCPPCLAKDLPRLVEFYERNRDKHTQFEIIGFIIDDSGELDSSDKLEGKLQPLVKNVWKGKDLPFPLLLDNSLTTWKTFGFKNLGTEVLVNPDGKLVKGGLKELAETIGATMPDTVSAAASATASAAPPTAHAKSVTVFPIVLTNNAPNAQAQVPPDMSRRVTEIVGVLLERAGMKEIELAEANFVPPDKSGLPKAAEAFGRFVQSQNLKTEYALYGHFSGTPGKGVEDIELAVVDRQGAVVLSEHVDKQRVELMIACDHLVRRLRGFWDLADPNRKDAPEGKMAELMEKRSGTPPKDERDAMQPRLDILKEKIKSSTIAVYPVRVSVEDGAKVAAALADMLTKQGVGRAEAIEADLKLKIQPDPNQVKIIWDTARAFQDFLRKNPPATDYALLAAYGIGRTPDGKTEVGGVNLILCDRNGDWVFIAGRNSHQADFQRINPKSPDDCNRLVVEVLKSTLY